MVDAVDLLGSPSRLRIRGRVVGGMDMPCGGEVFVGVFGGTIVVRSFFQMLRDVAPFVH